MPKYRNSNEAKINKYIDEFKCFMQTKDDMICIVCKSIVNIKKRSQVLQHLKTWKHEKNLNRSSGISTLVYKEKVEDNGISDLGPESKNIMDTVESSFKTDHIKVTSNETLQDFLQIFSMKMSLSNTFISKLNHFFTNYFKDPINDQILFNTLENNYQNKLLDLQRTFKNKYLWISYDETSDVKGRYFGNLIAGCYKSSICWLLDVKLIEDPNVSSISRFVCESLKKFRIDFKQVLAFISDGKSHLVKTGEALNICFPKLFHVICVYDNLNKIFSRIELKYKEITKLMRLCFRVTQKNPVLSNIIYKNQITIPTITNYDDAHLWFQDSFYYIINYEKLKSIIKSQVNDDQLLENLKNLFNNSKLENELNERNRKFNKIHEDFDQLKNREIVAFNSKKFLDKIISEYHLELNGEFQKSIDSNPGLKDLFQVDQLSYLSNEEKDMLHTTPITTSKVKSLFPDYSSILLDNNIDYEHIATDMLIKMTFIVAHSNSTNQ